MQKVNLQIVAMAVPAQEGITRDNVTMGHPVTHVSYDTPGTFGMRVADFIAYPSRRLADDLNPVKHRVCSNSSVSKRVRSC